MNQAAAPGPGPPAAASRRTPWKLVAAAAVVAVVAVVDAVVAGVMSTGAPVVISANITLQELVNRVEANRPRDPATDLINFLPATVGQDLLAGDGIKTYEASEARVDIVVGDFIRVTRTKPTPFGGWASSSWTKTPSSSWNKEEFFYSTMSMNPILAR